MSTPNKNRNWFTEQIKKLAGKPPAVEVDEESSLIVYSPDMPTDESRTKPLDPEELVHALTIQMLATRYDYPIGRIYHEKHYAHGSKGSYSDEVDIVVFDEDGLPFALWELKAPDVADAEEETAIENQLFGTAPLTGSPRLLVYGTIEPKGQNAEFKIKCIDYQAHKSYDSWVEAGRPHSKDFPKGYLDISYSPYVKGSAVDLKEDCTQSEFRSVAATFHNEFFGEHPDNTLFVNLVKCLLAKIYDERTVKTGEPYRFQIFVRAGKLDSAEAVFSQVNELYKDAYQRYIDPDSPESDLINEREFTPEHVKTVVLALEGMSLTRGAALHGDVIGTFFEEILRTGFKQDRGMYFTHDNLVRFMIDALDLEKLTHDIWHESTHPDNRLPYVMDPACGSGTFLLHAMNTITSVVRRNRKEWVADSEAQEFFHARLSDEKPNYWAERFIYGLDPKFIMAITAKVNMVLHGDGSAHIVKLDAFSHFSKYKEPQLRAAGEAVRSLTTAEYPPEMSETFDVVVSNPPFGVTLSAETRTTLRKTFTLNSKSPSEALFLERCFQLLKPNGRLGLVLPESILNTSDLLPARLLLYRLFWIRAIVSLPRNLFIDTPTLTSLLFAQKKRPEDIREWDELWSKERNTVDVVVGKVKSLLNKRARSGLESAAKLEEKVHSLLSPILGPDFWALRRGKNPLVLRLALPPELSAIEDAQGYYGNLLKSAGFQNALTYSVFGRVTNALSYDFPVYRVSEVGYKLSKRRERARPNHLARFRGTTSGRPVLNLHLCEEEYVTEVDAINGNTVLDMMRKHSIWDTPDV